MSVQNASAFVLAVDNGAGGYDTIGAFNTNNFTINGEPASYITKSSEGWEQLAAGTGSMSVEISGEGVLTSETLVKDLLQQRMDRAARDYQITLPGVATYAGPFMLTAMSVGGAAEETVSLSVTLRSASKPTFTAL